MSTAGALFLARERAEVVRAESVQEVPIAKREDPPQRTFRWPITDLMSERSFASWARILGELHLGQQ
jgi:hypothetical protein